MSTTSINFQPDSSSRRSKPIFKSKQTKTNFEERYNSLRNDLLVFLNEEIIQLGTRICAIESGSNKTILKIRKKDPKLKIDTLLNMKEKLLQIKKQKSA